MLRSPALPRWVASLARSGAIGVLSLVGVGCVEDAAPPVNGPPAPLPEFVTGPTAPGMVWVAGCWHWDGEGYVWLPGHWVSPPKGAEPEGEAKGAE